MSPLGRWGPPYHSATTRQTGGIYPFQAEAGLGSRGVFVGTDVYGSGCFSYDGWDLYERGIISCLNTIVAGQVGRGKSSLVKTVFELRPLEFGRKVRVLDPKGERRALCEALGTEPILLEPHGRMRVNPLDQRVIRYRAQLGEEYTAQQMLQEQATLLQTVESLSLGRDLVPIEHQGLYEALRRAIEVAAEEGREPLIGDVDELLFSPTDQMAGHLHTDPVQLAKDCRDLALNLQRMVRGDLAGMFDGPTSEGINFLAPYVCLDLSKVFRSAALPILMCCAAAWMQQALLAEPKVRQIWVIDEGWKLMGDLATARWARDTSKFSRQYGIQLVLVIHRFSDATAAGTAGSEQVAIAEGLLEDVETYVIYGQGHKQIQATKAALDLSDTEAAKVLDLPKGTGLWKIAHRSFVVEHKLSSDEKPLIHSDQAMAG